MQRLSFLIIKLITLFCLLGIIPKAKAEGMLEPGQGIPPLSTISFGSSPNF